MNGMKPVFVHKFIDTHLKSIEYLLKQVNHKINTVYQEPQGDNLLKPSNSQGNSIAKEFPTTGTVTDIIYLLKSYNDEFQQKNSNTSRRNHC